MFCSGSGSCLVCGEPDVVDGLSAKAPSGFFEDSRPLRLLVRDSRGWQALPPSAARCKANQRTVIIHWLLISHLCVIQRKHPLFRDGDVCEPGQAPEAIQSLLQTLHPRKKPVQLSSTSPKEHQNSVRLLSVPARGERGGRTPGRQFGSCALRPANAPEGFTEQQRTGHPGMNTCELNSRSS